MLPLGNRQDIQNITSISVCNLRNMATAHNSYGQPIVIVRYSALVQWTPPWKKPALIEPCRVYCTTDPLQIPSMSLFALPARRAPAVKPSMMYVRITNIVLAARIGDYCQLDGSVMLDSCYRSSNSSNSLEPDQHINYLSWQRVDGENLVWSCCWRYVVGPASNATTPDRLGQFYC